MIPNMPPCPSNYQRHGVLFPRYSISAAETAEDISLYQRLLETTYAVLGFLDSGANHFLPGPDTQRFLLRREATVVGLYSLTPVGSDHAYFSQYIPGFAQHVEGAFEINNIIILKPHPNTLGILQLLSHAIEYALAHEKVFLVGIARYAALKVFVEAGSVPVYHPPLHLLGQPKLKDFVTYFDLRSSANIDYIRQRAERLHHQICVLDAIKTDFIRSQRAAPMTPVK